jgi:hypothetical protein
VCSPDRKWAADLWFRFGGVLVGAGNARSVFPFFKKWGEISGKIRKNQENQRLACLAVLPFAEDRPREMQGSLRKKAPKEPFAPKEHREHREHRERDFFLCALCAL